MTFTDPQNPHADYAIREALKQAEVMITIGWVVSETNYGEKKVRLRRNLGGEPVETGWLRMPSIAAGKTKFWFPIRKGDVVALFAPNGNLNMGIPFLQFWTQSNPPPTTDEQKIHIEFEDKSLIEYDAGSGKLRMELKGGQKEFELKAPGGKIKLEAQETEIKGRLKVTETIDANGTIKSESDVRDPISTLRSVRTTYNTHTHALGSGVTLIPNQPVGSS